MIIGKSLTSDLLCEKGPLVTYLTSDPSQREKMQHTRQNHKFFPIKKGRKIKFSLLDNNINFEEESIDFQIESSNIWTLKVRYINYLLTHLPDKRWLSPLPHIIYILHIIDLVPLTFPPRRT
jgi:hypothetical protein